MTDRSRLSIEAASEKNESTIIPPWEARAVTQVPYLDRSATPPTYPRQQTGPWSRSSRSDSASQLKPKLVTANTAPTRSEYNSPISRDPATTPWSHRRYTTATQPPSSAPYETFIDPPPEAMNLPRPPVNIPQPPPSPPESCSFSSTKSMSPPPQEPSAHPIPGTMSSQMTRVQETPSKCAKTPRREPQVKYQPEQKPRKRFSSAFRDIFKREPVDESQLERIGDRHWTEEN